MDEYDDFINFDVSDIDYEDIEPLVFSDEEDPLIVDIRQNLQKYEEDEITESPVTFQICQWRTTNLYDIVNSDDTLCESLDKFEFAFMISQTRLNNASLVPHFCKTELLANFAIISADMDDDEPAVRTLTKSMTERLGNSGMHHSLSEGFVHTVDWMIECFKKECPILRLLLIYPFWLRCLCDLVDHIEKELNDRVNVLHSLRQKILESTEREYGEAKRDEVMDGILKNIFKFNFVGVDSDVHQLLLFLKSATDQPDIIQPIHTQDYLTHVKTNFDNFIALIRDVILPALMAQRSFYFRLPAFKEMAENGIENLSYEKSHKKDIREKDASRPKRKYVKSGKFSKKRLFTEEIKEDT